MILELNKEISRFARKDGIPFFSPTNAPSCRTERSAERHLITENYTIFKFFLSLNSKTFILKLFRYIVPIFFLFLSFIGAAQTEYTRYYNANWKPTTKDNASYIRKITYGKDGKPQGLVHDYFYDKWNDSIQGLQWEGYILSENLETGEDVCDGKCVWYNENGGIVQIASYKNGVLDGFFWRKRDWPAGKTKLGIFKDGKIDGWFFEYRSDKVYVYKDGNDLSHQYIYRRTQKNPCWDNDGDSVKIIPSERKKIYYNRSTPNVIQSYTVYWDTSYNKPQFKSQNYVQFLTQREKLS